MDHRVDAIPTKLHGINYRSRLEARWGEFFRLIRYNAKYEPIDLNGWIPDFVVQCRHRRNFLILVEVKPIFDFCEATANKIQSSILKSSISQPFEILLAGADGLGWTGYQCHIADSYANTTHLLIEELKSLEVEVKVLRGGFTNTNPFYGVDELNLQPNDIIKKNRIDELLQKLWAARERMLEVIEKRGERFTLQWERCSLGQHNRDKWKEAGNAVQWKKKGK